MTDPKVYPLEFFTECFSWGVTVAEAEFVNVEDTMVAGNFDEDFEF